MFQNVQKQQIVKILVGEDQEDVWATVTGTHNDGGLQVRVETVPDNGAVKKGQYLRIEKEDVFDVLKMGPCDDRD